MSRGLGCLPAPKCMYVCMYVCMYTMILPLHFSVPIYSPWQKNNKKNTQKIKRGAGPLPGPELQNNQVLNSIGYLLR